LGGALDHVEAALAAARSAGLAAERGEVVAVAANVQGDDFGWAEAALGSGAAGRGRSYEPR
jgi:hypothetical protein